MKHGLFGRVTHQSGESLAEVPGPSGPGLFEGAWARVSSTRRVTKGPASVTRVFRAFRKHVKPP